MQRDLDRWTRTSPESVAKGSIAQVIYCIRDARADILEMAVTVASQTTALRHARKVIQATLDDAVDSYTTGGQHQPDPDEAAVIEGYRAVLAEIDGALNG